MDHGSHGLRIKLDLKNNAAAMDIQSERTHMGFQPPTPTIANRSSSSYSAVSLLDCSISLPSWSLTGRRGRKSTTSSAAATVSSTVTVVTNKTKIDEVCDDALNSCPVDHLDSSKSKMHLEMKKRKTDEICNTTDKTTGLLEKKMRFEIEKTKIDELCNVTVTHPDQVGSSKKKMHHEIRKSKIGEVCDTPDKLIGSLENKMQLEREKSKIDELCNVIDVNFDHVSPSKEKVHGEQNNGMLKNEYKCNICGKAFSSPRALGGHKSSHYKPNKINTMQTKETASTETQTQEVEILIGTTMEASLDSTETGRKRMMDFDLNELPPMEDEEGIIKSCFLHL